MKFFNGTALPAIVLFGTTLLVGACQAAPGTPSEGAAPASSPPSATATQALPLITVHKSPDCGCCGVWVEHVRAAGFPVRVTDTEDMLAIKQRLGIPDEMLSCHTAEVDGYVVEGHVPVADIQRLLSERPAARGLVLPGMPVGSPGMESPDGYRQSFTVGLLEENGNVRGFSQHP
ncbi:DUF411 domain-containing protein [Stenotrophomonas maltophilia]|uniref:DUF411 domain-containing protein n=1 Tax=Stenotrophomonas maltophilia TaxID=40324 RepID=UPI003B9E6DDD